MRRFGSALLIGAFVSCATTVTPPDDTQIRGLLSDQAAAWSRGDLDAFCAVYADDATFVSPSGLTKGRQSVLARYRKKYVDRAGMGALSLDVQEVRTVDAGSASVVAHWTLSWAEKPKAEGSTLLVLRKIRGSWRIVQDASM